MQWFLDFQSSFLLIVKSQRSCLLQTCSSNLVFIITVKPSLSYLKHSFHSSFLDKFDLSLKIGFYLVQKIHTILVPKQLVTSLTSLTISSFFEPWLFWVFPAEYENIHFEPNFFFNITKRWSLDWITFFTFHLCFRKKTVCKEINSVFFDENQMKTVIIAMRLATWAPCLTGPFSCHLQYRNHCSLAVWIFSIRLPLCFCLAFSKFSYY